jgi:hypothetical protein
MSIDSIPTGMLFVLSVILVFICIEVGYRIGIIVRRKTQNEKESAVSAITGSILALLAFILAFTFGIVSNRYDTRKQLVRDEANAIRTAWLRSDFLPDSDRVVAKELLARYVDLRLDLMTKSINDAPAFIQKSTEIQNQLWDMAVTNARKDMNSDVAALYIESLNQVIEIQALRIAIGLQMRIPGGIWTILISLIIIAMLAVGYQTAISDSRRTWTIVLLATAFSLVIVLIAVLDRPKSRFIQVSQQPLIDVQTMISVDREGH